MAKFAQYPIPDRVLIVDAQADFATLLEAACLRADYLVQVVGESQSVASNVVEFQPDLIFLDLILTAAPTELASKEPASTETGGEHAACPVLLQSLAASKVEARIVLLSHASRRQRELWCLQGRELGLRMLAHMAKPVDWENLDALLETLRNPDADS